MTPPLTLIGMSGPISSLISGGGGGAEPGQQAFTSTGTTNWVVPTGVTEISAMCVGAGGGSAGTGSNRGGGGGGGGALAYGTFAVTPGETLEVIVGAHGNGGSGNTSSGQSGSATTIKRSSTILLSGGGGGGGLSALSSGSPQTSRFGSAGTSSGTERDGGGSGGQRWICLL